MIDPPDPSDSSDPKADSPTALTQRELFPCRDHIEVNLESLEVGRSIVPPLRLAPSPLLDCRSSHKRDPPLAHKYLGGPRLYQ